MNSSCTFCGDASQHEHQAHIRPRFFVNTLVLLTIVCAHRPLYFHSDDVLPAFTLEQAKTGDCALEKPSHRHFCWPLRFFDTYMKTAEEIFSIRVISVLFHVKRITEKGLSSQRTLLVNRNNSYFTDSAFMPRWFHCIGWGLVLLNHCNFTSGAWKMRIHFTNTNRLRNNLSNHR